MAEAGFPGYEMILTWGVVVPAGTPDPIVSKLEGWFAQMTARPQTQDFVKRMGGVPYPGDREKLATAISNEIKNWAEYVRLANIQPQ
jgi:tripartite-type tricarboxylate transporter receptor subunit TctC